MTGFDASDPARIGSYLAGYLGPDERLGDKEIQHEVPEGVGHGVRGNDRRRRRPGTPDREAAGSGRP